MKGLWNKLFNIDIDELKIDFSQYDIHLPPRVSGKELDFYFCDIPN
jgi:hypothetical protein